MRLTKKGSNKDLLNNEIEIEIEKLYSLIPKYIFGQEQEKMEQVIGELLRKDKLTISTAESCTGGAIANKLTGIPGSSDYFQGSVVAYNNDVKIVSYNAFNEAFDGHVLEYIIEDGRIINQNDLEITIGSPSGDEFYLTSNYNGKIKEVGLTGYKLHDIYPNPFNPSSQVSFTLPKESYVSLHAYDVRGERVDTIFEGYQVKGHHTYTWNASSLPSGVYYIKMISDHSSLSTKAMLLK